MEQPYQYTGAKTKFRPKLPPAQIAPAYPMGDPKSVMDKWLDVV